MSKGDFYHNLNFKEGWSKPVILKECAMKLRGCAARKKQQKKVFLLKHENICGHLLYGCALISHMAKQCATSKESLRNTGINSNIKGSKLYLNQLDFKQ